MIKNSAMKLKQYLKNLLSKDELEQLVGSYDVVGDIAIILIPDQLVNKELIIGQAILEINRKICVVAKRVGFYGGEYRTVQLQIIAGEERKETEVKEFGLRLKLNAETVYFSIRSGSERKRIASQVQEGESVLVLFSGVAPYPLVISKFSKAREIIGIEKNPKAHDYAVYNLGINKKYDNIKLMNGSAEVLLPRLAKRFNRIVMPLPTRGDTFLSGAIRVLKHGGWLHFYDLQHQDLFDSSINKIAIVCTTEGRQLGEADVIKCGHCAPRTHRICVDARIY